MENQAVAELTRTRASPGLEFVIRRLDSFFKRGLGVLSAARMELPLQRLYVELTHRCNLCCIMCDHWELRFKDPASPGREIRREEFEALLDGSTLLKNLRQVVFTGGEAMLRPDYGDIVGAAARRFPGASMTLLTNFMNPELVIRRLGELREGGVRRIWISVSLDGVGDSHDRVRGRAGTFERVNKTLDRVRREFPEHPIGFSFTATPENAGELWPAYEYSKSRNCSFVAQPMIQKEELERRFSFGESQREQMLSQIEAILWDLSVRHRFLDILARGSEKENWWRFASLLFWWNLRRTLLGEPWPFAGLPLSRRYALLDPECRLFYRPREDKRIIGNIRRTSFDELFLSDEARRIRAEVDGGAWDWHLFFIPWAMEDVARAALGLAAGEAHDGFSA